MAELQNESIIRSVFDAFGRGDIQTILDTCTADSEMNTIGPATLPYAGKRKGREEIQTHFAILRDTQSNQKLTIDQFVTQGDTVVAIGRYAATVKSTGKSAEAHLVIVFTMRDGKIAKQLVVGDTAAAVAAYTGAAAASS